MAKAYWVATVDVSDVEGMKTYSKENRAALKRFGAKFIVRHGQQQIVEGTSRRAQTVIEFPSYEAALAAYRDPEYQAAAKFRHDAAKGDLVIVEGYDGPFEVTE